MTKGLFDWKDVAVLVALVIILLLIQFMFVGCK
jgi:hypothetical protein